MDETTLRAQLQEAGRYLLQNDLAWGNAGNLSARLPGAGTCWITASGTRLGELTDDDLVPCPVDGPLPGGLPCKPSKEVPMHTAVYRLRPEIHAVLHSSPFYSTLVASSGLPVPADWFVECMYYLERVERVVYAHPGSPDLGTLVAEKAPCANVLLLENHGVLVYDISVREALMGLHTLEIACRMLITARSAGVEMKPLSQATVDGFLNRSGYRPRREWPR